MLLLLGVVRQCLNKPTWINIQHLNIHVMIHHRNSPTQLRIIVPFFQALIFIRSSRRKSHATRRHPFQVPRSIMPIYSYCFRKFTTNTQLAISYRSPIKIHPHTHSVVHLRPCTYVVDWPRYLLLWRPPSATSTIQSVSHNPCWACICDRRDLIVGNYNSYPVSVGCRHTFAL